MSPAPDRRNPGESATWPKEELESLVACPVCRSSSGIARYSGLLDKVFRTAPGLWEMSQCAECGLFYLNPRPTAMAMGRAYADYYTHAEDPVVPRDRSAAARLWTGCRNDYVHHRLAVATGPRIPGGRWLLAWNAGLCRTLLHEGRHLRLPRAGARLLDIGCGSGSFLAVAREMGWDACGLEPDAQAVRAAQERGINVTLGGFPDTGLPADTYDAVTLSHVIEHVHDPIAALREVLRILKPGGRVWIATPNAGSASSRLFQHDWRGLEPPRHLALFTHSALRRALERAGFTGIRLQPPKLSSGWYFSVSARLRDPDTTRLSAALRLRAWVANLVARFCRFHGEELCVLAQKPEYGTLPPQEPAGQPTRWP